LSICARIQVSDGSSVTPNTVSRLFRPVSPSSSAGNPAVTGVERKTPEGAFHNVGYPVALIVPVPPVVRYLSVHPSKIVY
jgi:hypothetical protein